MASSPMVPSPLSAAALRSLSPQAAAALPPLLHAMWHDAQGDWDRAHKVAQDVETPHGAWVHAFLHRREGDTTNAAYWYRRAGKPAATSPLQAEWDAIVTALLNAENLA